MIRRLNNHNKRQPKKNVSKSNVIRKPAGDDWF